MPAKAMLLTTLGRNIILKVATVQQINLFFRNKIVLLQFHIIYIPRFRFACRQFDSICVVG